MIFYRLTVSMQKIFLAYPLINQFAAFTQGLWVQVAYMYMDRQKFEMVATRADATITSTIEEMHVH